MNSYTQVSFTVPVEATSCREWIVSLLTGAEFIVWGNGVAPSSELEREIRTVFPDLEDVGYTGFNWTMDDGQELHIYEMECANIGSIISFLSTLLLREDFSLTYIGFAVGYTADKPRTDEFGGAGHKVYLKDGKVLVESMDVYAWLQERVDGDE